MEINDNTMMNIQIDSKKSIDNESFGFTCSENEIHDISELLFSLVD